MMGRFLTINGPDSNFYLEKKYLVGVNEDHVVIGMFSNKAYS